jgi:hypothetical protein
MIIEYRKTKVAFVTSYLVTCQRSQIQEKTLFGEKKHPSQGRIYQALSKILCEVLMLFIECSHIVDVQQYHL